MQWNTKDLESYYPTVCPHPRLYVCTCLSTTARHSSLWMPSQCRAFKQKRTPSQNEEQSAVVQHGPMHSSHATLFAMSSGRWGGGTWLPVLVWASLLPTCAVVDGGLCCQCVQAPERDLGVFLEVGAWFGELALGCPLCITGRLFSIGGLFPSSRLSLAGAGECRKVHWSGS